MKEYSTPDLSLAEYLLMKGMRLLSAEKTLSGKFNFSFSDPDSKAQKLAVDFLNSDFSDYDNHVRNLKKIIYSK